MHVDIINMLSRASSTDPHKGFAHVEFASPEDALEAIDNMDQSELFGRVIRVNHAKPQKDASEGLGSKRAVWEQVFLPCPTLSGRVHVIFADRIQ